MHHWAGSMLCKAAGALNGGNALLPAMLRATANSRRQLHAMHMSHVLAVEEGVCNGVPCSIHKPCAGW